MAVHAVQGVAKEWFTPDSEKMDADGNEITPEDPASFYIRPLDQNQMLEVVEHTHLADDTVLGGLTARGIRTALRNGLLDWKGIYDANGEAMTYGFEKLGHIPWAMQSELASRIIEITQLGEAAQKN